MLNSIDFNLVTVININVYMIPIAWQVKVTAIFYFVALFQKHILFHGMYSGLGKTFIYSMHDLHNKVFPIISF